MRALWRSSLLGIPASTLLALILGELGAAPRGGSRFVAFVSIADVVTMAERRPLPAPAAPGRGPRTATRSVCSARCWSRSAWGSPAVFALPGLTRTSSCARCTCSSSAARSATYVVGTAARAPLLLRVAAADARTRRDRVHRCPATASTRLLGFAVPIYFIVMTSLHHEVHGVVVSELQLREHNDEANAQLREANEQLTRRALRDELTGLANRAAFVDMLQRAVADARDDGSIVGVLYFDVDRLKVVNDSLGHATGDMLLVQIAERVHRMLRTTDVLARLGGDEFTMLLDKLRSNGEAVDHRGTGRRVVRRAVPGRRPVDQRLREHRGRDQPRHHRRRRVAAVVRRRRAVPGQAERPEPHRGVRHQAARRDRVAARRRARVARRRSRTSRSSRGSSPRWICAPGRYVGAEALARWNHPERGVLDAWKFVPLAEETGLVFALDDAVVARAVATRARARGRRLR